MYLLPEFTDRYQLSLVNISALKPSEVPRATESSVPALSLRLLCVCYRVTPVVCVSCLAIVRGVCAALRMLSYCPAHAIAILCATVSHTVGLLLLRWHPSLMIDLSLVCGYSYLYLFLCLVRACRLAYEYVMRRMRIARRS